jgi:hypothetical protein
VYFQRLRFSWHGSYADLNKTGQMADENHSQADAQDQCGHFQLSSAQGFSEQVAI